MCLSRLAGTGSHETCCNPVTLPWHVWRGSGLQLLCRLDAHGTSGLQLLMWTTLAGWHLASVNAREHWPVA